MTKSALLFSCFCDMVFGISIIGMLLGLVVARVVVCSTAVVDFMILVA